MKSNWQPRIICRTVLRIVLILLLPLFSHSQAFFGVSSSPTDNNAQAGPSVTVVPPTGMVAGDLVVVYVHYRANSITLSVSQAGGQTWNTATTTNGSTQTFSIFWCEFNGTWSASPIFYAGAAGNNLPMSAIMYVYNPSNPNSTWGINIAAVNSTTSTNAHSITGITTTAPNTVTMGFWGNASANTWGTLSGTGWIKTGMGNYYRNTSGSDQSHTAAYIISSAPATIPAVSQTQSGGIATLQSIVSWHEVNDLCDAVTPLSQGTVCTSVSGTLQNSSVSSPFIATTCGSPAGGDVWYSFVALTTNPTITLSNLGASLTGNARIQLFSGTCGSLTNISCISGNTLTTSGLTLGATYYVRVYSGTASPTGSAWDFDICVTDAVNDGCANAVQLVSNTTCSKYYSTLGSSTYVVIPSMASSCGTLNSQDVWFKFVAKTAYPVITVGDKGSNWGTLLRISLLTGSCSGLTEIACASNAPLDTRTTPGGAGLTVGTTYYVRIYKSNNTAPAATNWEFTICITDPVAGTYDYGRSYVNLTKKTTGGTVDPGDSLEIRTTFVVRTGTADSLSFMDTIYKNRGFTLAGVTDSITVRTNEGKRYWYYTDNNADADGGSRTSFGASPDTAIKINFGLGGTRTARGKLRNTSKPSVFGGTCILMCTYRVKVNAAYGTKIRFGGGAITYRDSATGILNTVNFKSDSLIVYLSPGLCPNAVSVTNAVGIETNGTFGAPTNPAPLARNRAASPYVPGYIYNTFSPAGGPGDYYYGITNNTSGLYTLLQNWNKPDPTTAPTYRIFGHWDIIGDHTGATNTGKGNSPCDTTLPVSASNPCGYMLVINSAYKTDTAFQYNVSNVCPNTYYEISAWVRNICYKCACDSNGNSAVTGTTPAYVPTAPGDSSGVQPNLAFDVDGTDYYTTGNIAYYGTTPTKSDTSNRWVKRGFTYLTGTGQTSFVLTIRNNAPGGGGNDWALDDITVATCLPNMKYSPTINPSVCDSNTITISDTVRSYFNNYVNYKWQRSTDGGANWSDIPGATGVGIPFWNGTAWEYVANYVVPTTMTYAANNGDKYRLIVATTSGNLASLNCQVTDGVSIVTLTVINCGPVLSTDLLSFNGKLIADKGKLSWTMSKQDGPLVFTIERSNDGINFFSAGTLNSNNNYNSEVNYYSFIDPVSIVGKVWYRLVITNAGNNKKNSRTIQLSTDFSTFALSNVVNPFNNELVFEVTTTQSVTISAELIDMFGKTVRKTNYMVYTGVNSIRLTDTNKLPAGMYTLRILNKEMVLTKQVIKLL